jgi:hypothetical protein
MMGHYMKKAKNYTKPKNEGTKSDQTPNWITNMNHFFGIEPTSTQQLEGVIKSKQPEPSLDLDLGNMTIEKTPDYKVISKVETGPHTSEVKIRLFSPMKKSMNTDPNQPGLLP